MEKRELKDYESLWSDQKLECLIHGAQASLHSCAQGDLLFQVLMPSAFAYNFIASVSVCTLGHFSYDVVPGSTMVHQADKFIGTVIPEIQIDFFHYSVASCYLQLLFP